MRTDDRYCLVTYDLDGSGRRVEFCGTGCMRRYHAGHRIEGYAVCNPTCPCFATCGRELGEPKETLEQQIVGDWDSWATHLGLAGLFSETERACIVRDVIDNAPEAERAQCVLDALDRYDRGHSYQRVHVVGEMTPAEINDEGPYWRFGFKNLGNRKLRVLVVEDEG